MTLGRLGLIGGSDLKRVSGVYSSSDNLARQNSINYLTSFSYDGKFNPLTQAGSAQGFTFSRDGMYLLVCTPGTRTTAKITEWILGTPFDISTAVYQAGRDFLAGDYDINVNSIFSQQDYFGVFYFGGSQNDTVWLAYYGGGAECLQPVNKKFYLGAQDTAPRSIRFSSNGMKMYYLGSTNRLIYQYTLASPYDISSASYSNKSLAVTQDTNPLGIYFSSSGTQAYMIGSTSRAIFSYNLSTAWDVSTGVSDYTAPLSYSVATQAASPRSVYIGDNGTKMYVLNVVASTSAAVFQYTLSTPYNITTATYASKTVSVFARDSEAWEIFFKPDGTKMYVLGNTNDAVFSYTLSTAWDVSTAIADYTPRSFSVATQASVPWNTFMGDSGTKMYVLNQATNSVFQYTLSTPYNVTTAVYATKTLSVATQESTVRGMFFKSDGTKMYIIGTANNTIFSYTLSTPWDVSTGVADYVSKSFLYSGQSTTGNDVFIGDNGTKMYVLSGGAATTDTVFQYTLSIAWDVSSASYASKSFIVNTQSASTESIYFSSSGTKMYILGDSGDAVFQYSLSTAWDVSTSSYDNINFSVIAQETVPCGLFFSSDGTRMYVSGQTGDDINQYALSTPWAVNTASYVRVSSVIAEPAQQCLSFKSDGTKLYVLGNTGSIFEYTLSTAWDVSTISLSRSQSIAFLDNVPRGLFFKDDGTKVYIQGDTNDRVYELTLTVPWQVTSVSGRYSVLSEETSCSSIYISPDGLNMYITGQTGDDVNQYSLSTAWDTSSATFIRVSSTHGEATVGGIYFKSDGTKMYIIGSTLDTIREFSLSTPWDISTASLYKTRYVGNFDTTPTGIHISPDGLNMYITGDTNNSVYQFTLSQAWMSNYFAGYVTVQQEETTATDMYISPDGLNLYVGGNVGDDVNQYALDIAWDISTANYVRVSASIVEAEQRGLFFSNDGTRMHVTGQSNDEVREYLLSTAWDVSTATLVDIFYYGHIAGSVTSLHFSQNGLFMYFVNGSLIYRFTLSTAFRSNKVVGTYCVTKEETVPTTLCFLHSGATMYVAGQTGDDINRYSLSTPWDISTITYVEVSATHGEATVTGIDATDDGSSIYIVGTTLKAVRSFTSSSGNLASMALNTTYSVAFEQTPSGICLATFNGIVNEFMIGTTNDCIYFTNGGIGYVYIGGSEASMRSLSVGDGAQMYSGGSAIRKFAFLDGLHTATISQTFSITEPYGVHVSQDGLRIYIALGTTTASNTGRSIRLARMTSPNDLSTATLDTVEIIGAPGLIGNPANLWNIFVSPDEMRMFVLSPAVQGIYQFSRRF